MALHSRCGKFLRLCSLGNGARFSRSCSDSSPQNKGLVLGAYYDEATEGVQLTPAAAKFDQSCQGKLSEHIRFAGNKLKSGKSLLFWGLNREYQSVALVGLGKKNKDANDLELVSEEKEAVRIAASAGCRALDGVEIKNIFVEGLGDPEAAAEGSKLGTWKFQEYKTKKSAIAEVNYYDRGASSDRQKWDAGIIKAEAQNLARKLADTPSNMLTPTIFSEEIARIFASLNVEVEIRDKQWAEREKMNAFLAVGQGSVEPPRFVELSYRGSDAGKPFVLIGKGVTFDAGGISLKPASCMDEMRADMGGAASVVGALHGLARLSAECNVKVLIPMVENMPSGTAIKPGDVITARNGKTICVDNTDAEGRLILADTLSYSSTLNPKWVLDVATLTGAMRVALGDGATGTFTNSNSLYGILEKAASRSGDRVWRFPLWKHYSKQICQNTAYDLNNIGKCKGGGSCTAAAFLWEFVPEKTEWLHLDIAGVMGPSPSVSCPYLEKGMTGRPTRTLIEFIQSQ